MSNDRTSSASSVDATTPTTAPVPQRSSSTSVCILLVEDDQVLRTVSADTLSDLGYRSIRAADGPQALAALERERDVKVLMTDIGLPGMDGRQLAIEARRRRPGIGILFVTGYDDLIKKGQALRQDGLEYLAKPYGFEDLASALKRLLDFGTRNAEGRYGTSTAASPQPPADHRAPPLPMHKD
jgi:CheY-like chemotaxis protein